MNLDFKLARRSFHIPLNPPSKKSAMDILVIYGHSWTFWDI